MLLKNINQVIKNNLCLGCGLCCLEDKTCQMIVKDGHPIPSKIVKSETIEKVCPAKGYDIYELGKKIFKAEKYKYELGWYNRLNLVHSNDSEILKNASSGGAITEIALFLLERNHIDGVICTNFIYDNNKVRTNSYIATNKEELVKAQGSKYCPSSTLKLLPDLLNDDKKYAIIGTPCQIAGLRLLQQTDSRYKDKITYTISNFCGGYRDYRELDYFIEKIAKFDSVSFFRHRGSGQPGSMKIINKEGKVYEYPYPDYAKLSPFLKNERCTLCIDATGELSDFSCGDAWIDKSLTGNKPFSIVISRNKNSEKILDEMSSVGIIEMKPISEYDTISSQKFNIDSKKYRQKKRLLISELMCMRVPNWKNRLLDSKKSSYWKEFKVLISKYLTKHKYE